MPALIYCSNTFCRGFTDRPGGLCPECQRKADAAKKRRWTWAGWSRQEESAQLRGHHKKDGGK